MNGKVGSGGRRAAVYRWAVVGALAAAVTLAVTVRDRGGETVTGAAAADSTARALPRLLELGSDQCVQCKAMLPILDELRAEYPGRLQVDFIDVWKQGGASRYGVSVIPTQILFAADGTELYRHQGFFAKAEIVARFAEFGVDLGEPARPAAPPAS